MTSLRLRVGGAPDSGWSLVVDAAWIGLPRAGVLTIRPRIPQMSSAHADASWPLEKTS